MRPPPIAMRSLVRPALIVCFLVQANAYLQTRPIHHGVFANMPVDWQPELLVYEPQRESPINVSWSPLRVRSRSDVEQCKGPFKYGSLETCGYADNKELDFADSTMVHIREGTFKLPSVYAKDKFASRIFKVDFGNDLQGVWWVGNVDSHRLLWPVRPADVRTIGIDEPPYVDDRPWDGKRGVRLAGVMCNPEIYTTADGGVDPHNGRINLGVTLRMPNSTGALVHAPVDGLVIWSDLYNITRPPFDSDVNNRFVWLVMLRDSWGFVHQISGLDPLHVFVHQGDPVKQGMPLGYTPFEPLSEIPEYSRPPVNPVNNFRAEGVPPYPYRFHALDISVSLPITGDIYPLDDFNYNYYNPLLFYPVDDYQSDLRPSADPEHLYVGEETYSSLLNDSGVDTLPNVYVHAANTHHAVSINSVVSLYANFHVFYPTPGDPDDAYDPQSVHALDYAVLEEGETCANARWMTLSEHSVWSFWSKALYAHEIRVRPGVLRPFGARIASRFDERERSVVYFITDLHPRRMRKGRNRLAVRARDFFGRSSCVCADVIVEDTDARALHLSHILTLLSCAPMPIAWAARTLVMIMRRILLP